MTDIVNALLVIVNSFDLVKNEMQIERITA